MTDTITVTGLVATPPRHIVTSEGLTITSFRLASNQRRFDRSANAWIDGDTNWYTVTSFRQLGTHVATSVEKGHRVIVTGRVRIRDWSTEDKKGTTIEIDADAVGHDLTWGRASFTRTVVLAPAGEKDGSDATESVDGPEESDASAATEQVGAGAADAPF